MQSTGFSTANRNTDLPPRRLLRSALGKFRALLRTAERAVRRRVPRSLRQEVKSHLRRAEVAFRSASPRWLREGVRPFARWINPGSRLNYSGEFHVADHWHGLPATAEHGRPVRFVLLSEDAVTRLTWAESLGGEWCRVEDPRHYVECEEEYVFQPTTAESAPSFDALRSVYLAACASRADLLVISLGIAAAPELTAVSRRDNVVAKAKWRRFLLDDQAFPGGLRGWVLRLLGEHRPSSAKTNLVDLLGTNCVTAGQAFTTGQKARAIGQQPAQGDFAHLDQADAGDDRPVILVLPGVFAVGGVERNTIEVLRQLRNRYRFVLATTEPHEPSRGAIHHQLHGLCEGIYDLGEIAPPQHHLEILQSLQDRYQFDCIWIVNGSVWLSENLATFRHAFADIPIIDQQVYDTEHGWISCYSNPAILTFDRHIAINSRIAVAFQHRFGIDPQRISLIYHAIDSEKWQAAAAAPPEADAVRAGWGVAAEVPLIGFVGRLTQQKQPLDFLNLASRSQADGRQEVFLVVGDGELAETCRQYIAQHRLTNVRMTGFLDDPSEVFAVLSGLVITSSYEGLPIVSLEAMATGVPILATDVGDLRLVCEQHGTGTFFEANVFTGDAGADSRYGTFKEWRAGWSGHKERAERAASGIRCAFSSGVIANKYDEVFREAMAAFQPMVVQAGTNAAPNPVSADYASISIVMPTWNRAQFLETAIMRYAQAARQLDYELIVIDDGSTDDTSKLLWQASRINPRLRYQSIANGGPGRARNIGVQLACKDVVLFVGDDILPCDDRFVRTHARLHATRRDEEFAVLGKVVWPSDGSIEVNAVMRHIQGCGGEQFGYAHLRPYSYLDWRFFYTCNVSVKRGLVANWLEEGFSADFPQAAFEDGEFAYRMSLRSPGLRLYYEPAALGSHHHVHTMKTFLDRQLSVGMMAAVFIAKHPEVAKQLGVKSLLNRMAEKENPARGHQLPETLAVIEGVKAFALLLEARGGLGDNHWHTAFMQALFQLVMQQGFVLGWSARATDTTIGYECILAEFLGRITPIVEIEMPGMSEAIAGMKARLTAA